MNTSFTFYQPPDYHSINNENIHYWYQANELYREKRYRDSFIHVLKFLNEKAVNEKVHSNTMEFKLAHGSVLLEMQLDATDYSIRVPFLKATNESLPVLRRVLELNFNVLTLSQIYLEDDILYFFHKDSLETAEPHKILELIREICLHADHYDDLFTREFRVELPPGVTHLSLSKEELESDYEQFTASLTEGIEASRFFLNKRFFYLALQALIISLLKTDYYLIPEGYVKSELNEILAKALDSEENEMVINTLVDRIDKLKNLSFNDFSESMYKPQNLIPLRRFISLEEITSDISQVKTESLNLRNEAAYMPMVMQAQRFFLELLETSQVPVNIEQKIHNALLATSNRPFKESSDTLMQLIYDIEKITRLADSSTNAKLPENTETPASAVAEPAALKKKSNYLATLHETWFDKIKKLVRRNLVTTLIIALGLLAIINILLFFHILGHDGPDKTEISTEKDSTAPGHERQSPVTREQKLAGLTRLKSFQFIREIKAGSNARFFLGYIINNTDRQVYMPRIDVSLHNSKGDVIASGQGYSYFSTLNPGEKGITRIYLRSGADYSSITANVTFPSYASKYIRPEMTLQITGSERKPGRLLMKGSITNNDKYKATFVKLVSWYTDSEGNILDAGLKYITTDGIDPGDSKEFTYNWYTKVKDARLHYEYDATVRVK